MGCIDPVQAERIKTKRDCGACSLRGKSFAPKWDTDPVTEFRALLRIRKVETYRTAEFAPGQDRNGQGDGPPRAEIFVCLGKEAPGIVLGVWVRNVRGGSGNFVYSDEAHDGGDIAALEGAKQEAGG